MNVLLIGSGGREHALAWKIAQSPLLGTLHAAPGSAAMAGLAAPADAAVDDHPAVVAFCAQNAIDLVVIGPEAPLAAGLADALSAAGVPVFGPGRAAAQLEASKAFAKDFMKRHRIPAARSEVFSDPAAAKAALGGFGLPVVVKADGLAAGKGVKVCLTAAEAREAIEEYMDRGTLGAAGKTVLLEEFLEGRETTILGICDGKSFVTLPPSSDHKRLLAGDRGPNTGGMGVVAPTPEVTPEIMNRIRSEIIDPILSGLAEDALAYSGVLYCGLMLTAAGPKVLEFNVRFGDPETQAVLPLLDDDLLALMRDAAAGILKKQAAAWHGAAVTVVLASEGYPASPLSGRPIRGIERAAAEQGVLIFHAGTSFEDGTWRTAGGRVLGVTGLAADSAAAKKKAYRAAAMIEFQGKQYREDIGGNSGAQLPAEVSS